MNTIKIYCKANKRTRDENIIRVCAHIIKEGELYEEDAYTIELEGNGVKLELAALTNALLDLESNERLSKEKNLDLYVHNEFLYNTLVRWEEKCKDGMDGVSLIEEKYTEEWAQIEELIRQCASFKIYGLEKKHREEDNEEIKKIMGHMNRMVCNKVNEQ